MNKIAEYRKAIVALLYPALVVLGASLLEDSVGGSAVTHGEWVAIAIAALGTSGFVYAVPNRRPRRKPAEPALPDQLS